MAQMVVLVATAESAATAVQSPATLAMAVMVVLAVLAVMAVLAPLELMASRQASAVAMAPMVVTLATVVRVGPVPPAELHPALEAMAWSAMAVTAARAVMPERPEPGATVRLAMLHSPTAGMVVTVATLVPLLVLEEQAA
jgi:hypothetical protein